MSRLVMLMAVLAVLAAAGYLALSILRGAASVGRAQAARIDISERPMQKISFVLLVALILYTAIWGGA